MFHSCWHSCKRLYFSLQISFCTIVTWNCLNLFLFVLNSYFGIFLLPFFFTTLDINACLNQRNLRNSLVLFYFAFPFSFSPTPLLLAYLPLDISHRKVLFYVWYHDWWWISFRTDECFVNLNLTSFHSTKMSKNDKFVDNKRNHNQYLFTILNAFSVLKCIYIGPI